MVPMTEVSPSSSGRPAATKAPNANIRMMGVIGSEIVSALGRSSESIFSMDSPELAPPNCSIRSSGCALCAAAVVRRCER
jgi:hypothetical protein